MNSSDFDIGVLTPIAGFQDPVTWIIMLLCIVLIGLARLNNFSYIFELFNPSTNYNHKMISLTSRSSYFLLINFFLITSLFFAEFFDDAFSQKINSSIHPVFIILSAFTVFLTLKVGLMLLIANWFKRKVLFDINNLLHYYQIMGIILVPIIGISYFQGDIVRFWATIIILVSGLSLFLYFSYKSLKLALQYNISFFYIILYLCTLEIMPLLLIVRYLVY